MSEICKICGQVQDDYCELSPCQGAFGGGCANRLEERLMSDRPRCDVCGRVQVHAERCKEENVCWMRPLGGMWHFPSNAAAMQCWYLGHERLTVERDRYKLAWEACRAALERASVLLSNREIVAARLDEAIAIDPAAEPEKETSDG